MASSSHDNMDEEDSRSAGFVSAAGSPNRLFDSDRGSVSPTRAPFSAFPTHRRVSSSFNILDDISLDESTVARQSLQELQDKVNGAGIRRSSVASPNGRESSLGIKVEHDVEKADLSSFATPDVLQDKQGQSRNSLDHVAQDDESPRKRRKAMEKKDVNEDNRLFVAAYDANDNSKEGFGVAESREHAKNTLQGPNAKTPDRTNRQSTTVNAAAHSPEEEAQVYGSSVASSAVTPRRRARRSFQRQRITKPGQGRRQPTESASDADEVKIRMDFFQWEGEEKIRKGFIGPLDPVTMYWDVKALIADEDEDENSNYTAAQVTLMILSLGSTQAIVELKAIMDEMRGLWQIEAARPPVKLCKNREEVLKLVRWVFNYTKGGTAFNHFQSRYYITKFYHYVIFARNRQMKKRRGATAEDVERSIYAALIKTAYPHIPRYRPARAHAAKVETSEFQKAVIQLQTHSKLGYHWLALHEKFGIGIMALYYHSKLFSETAKISLDDLDLSEQEFNLLMAYLSTEGNAHSAWLKILCDKINPHVRQGAEGILLRPELFVERWQVEEIMSCHEQSDMLSMMCETLDGVKKRLGNNVTEEAWKDIGRKTKLTAWLKGVKKGVYSTVREVEEE